MTDLEAIALRASRRSYLDTPIERAKVDLLQENISRCNRESGLHIQFVEDGSKAFGRLNKSYGLFSGVHSLLALVGKKDDIHLQEKLGYCGELLVLEATKLKLGTCWVAGTYDTNCCPCGIAEDEALCCVITIGYARAEKTTKERFIAGVMHRYSKPPERFYTTDTAVPGWFMEGVKAVQRAPSAINKQPIHLDYSGGTVRITLERNGYALDLGIAKLHFELAAGGRFALGNNAVFTKA